MGSRLYIIIVSSLLIVPQLFSCAAEDTSKASIDLLALQRQYGEGLLVYLPKASLCVDVSRMPKTPPPSRNLLYEALTSISSNRYSDFVEQYGEYVDQFKNRCGICGDSIPENGEWWAHPLGDNAHADCLKSIHRFEADTMNGLEYRSATCDTFYDFHRLVIFYVMKLCMPKTIAEFKKHDEKQLGFFYRACVPLAINSYTKYIGCLEKKRFGKNNEELKQDKLLFLAGLFMGEAAIQKVSRYFYES